MERARGVAVERELGWFFQRVPSEPGFLENMKIRSLLAQCAVFLRSRKPELALFLLGVLLRVTMAWTYNVDWSYDSDQHWLVVRWIAEHGRVPPVDATFESFHPPLYYVISAILFKHGVSHAHMVWIAIVSGVVRLGLLWAGFELYLPHSRLARISALALSAVLAASVHADGMTYPEPLSGMWCAAALLLIPIAFKRRPERRWRLAIALGLLLGVAMVTKISAVAIILSLGVGAGAEAVFSRRDWRTRAKGLATWAVTLAVCLAVCGWYFERNVRDYGTPFVTSFDLPFQHNLVADTDKLPYLERRTLAYVFGWSRAMNDYPYYPTAITTHPMFFPVVVASTFVDFYNYGFSGIDPSTKSDVWAGHCPLSTQILTLSQDAMLAGTVIFLATVAAWFMAARATARRRDWGLFTTLLAPACMTALALHFAIRAPVDAVGVVKSAYMQFASGPLDAVFGLAVAWSLQKSIRWPLFAALLASLWTVAAYTLYCRLRLPMLPLS